MGAVVFQNVDILRKLSNETGIPPSLSKKLNLFVLFISTIWIYRNYTIRGHWFRERSERKLCPHIVIVRPLLSYNIAISQPRSGNNEYLSTF